MVAMADKLLLRRYARSRDAESFHQLVHRHAHLVYAVAVRITRNHHDAQDITQLCFLDLARQANTIRNIPAWLHSDATFRAIDLVRRSDTRHYYESSPAAASPASSQDPVAATQWREIETLLDAAIADLPLEVRLPLIARYLEGKSQADIASELGLSQKTVSRRLAEGLQALRQKLGKSGFAVSVLALTTGLESIHAAPQAPASLLASISKVGIAGIPAAAASLTLKSVLVAGLTLLFGSLALLPLLTPNAPVPQPPAALVPSSAPARAAIVAGIEEGPFANLVPQQLVSLKDNRPWGSKCERWQLANVPRHPLDLLASSTCPEPQLKAWIENWQGTMWRGEKPGDGDRKLLEAALQTCDLPAMALLEAGESFDLAGDEATAALWFRRGILRAEKEAAILPAGDGRTRRLAEVLVGVQSLMWRAQNRVGVAEDADLIKQGLAFERLNRLLVAILPLVDEQRRYAEIGVVEALYLQRRQVDALAYADTIDSSGWDTVQQAGLAWAKALPLYVLRRYTDAIPFLEKSAQETRFHHSKQAWPMLIQTLCRSGLGHEAQRRLQQYETLYKGQINRERLISLKSEVQEALLQNP